MNLPTRLLLVLAAIWALPALIALVAPAVQALTGKARP